MALAAKVSRATMSWIASLARSTSVPAGARLTTGAVPPPEISTWSMRSAANAAAASSSDGVVDTFATLCAETSSRFWAAAMPETAIDNTLVIGENSAPERKFRCAHEAKMRDAAASRSLTQCECGQKINDHKGHAHIRRAPWSFSATGEPCGACFE